MSFFKDDIDKSVNFFVITLCLLAARRLGSKWLNSQIAFDQLLLNRSEHVVEEVSHEGTQEFISNR